MGRPAEPRSDLTGLDERGCQGAPEWIIEVLSPPAIRARPACIRSWSPRPAAPPWAGCWRAAAQPRRIRGTASHAAFVMPLPLPSPRHDRPRRRVEPSAAPLREPPQRTYAFDPNAARQAWRQVARTRGAHAMRLDGRDPGTGRLAMVALGLVAAAAVLLWWTSDDGSEGRDAVASVRVEADAASPSSPSSRAGLLPSGMLPEPQSPVPAGAPSFADASEELEPPMPRTVAERFVPPGTLEGHAKALRKLPHASTDRAPVGGIGPEGMHIDRIAMGTSIQNGACMGPTGNFSIRADDHAHVCFRVVHPRIEQRVVVRWEQNGRLVRRTVVPIADSHAYRTRATLPLRRKFAGEWTVRIVSTDGIELAAHSFQVGP